MSFRFPDTFYNDNEDYITKEPIEKFIKSIGIKGIRTSDKRKRALDRIVEYANESAKHQLIVEDWLDNVVKYGKKEIYIHRIENTLFEVDRLKKKEVVDEILSGIISTNRHIVGNRFDSNLKLYRVDYQDNIISFSLCKLIYSIDSKEVNTVQLYPIIVDIYIDLKIIIAKVKQKVSILEYISGKCEVDDLKTTSPEKEAKGAIVYICNLFNLSIDGNVYQENEYFEKRLYNYVKKYTGTPKEIQEYLDKNQEIIDKINRIYQEKFISLNEELSSDFSEDIRNTFEKYLSITRTDTNIFKNGNKAFPLRLMASDEEMSKVDETAGKSEPLQSRSIFFDNKKMINKNKRCTGVIFSVLKEGKEEGTKRFNVKYRVSKGYCVVSWQEYLMEEDINYVIDSIIKEK